MQYEQLIMQIQTQTGLTSQEDAEEALRATLETLSTGISEDLAEELAFQLPDEIARAVRPKALVAAGGGDRMDRREFVHRVAEACHLDDDQAARIIPGVFTAIGQATGPAVIEHIRDALPTELRSLVSTGGIAGSGLRGSAGQAGGPTSFLEEFGDFGTPPGTYR